MSKILLTALIATFCSCSTSDPIFAVEIIKYDGIIHLTVINNSNEPQSIEKPYPWGYFLLNGESVDFSKGTAPEVFSKSLSERKEIRLPGKASFSYEIPIAFLAKMNPEKKFKGLLQFRYKLDYYSNKILLE